MYIHVHAHVHAQWNPSYGVTYGVIVHACTFIALRTCGMCTYMYMYM